MNRIIKKSDNNKKVTGDASSAEESTRGNIVKETLHTLNETFQTPHIFITINIGLLLLIFVLGRIAIVFIEPPEPRVTVNLDQIIKEAEIETERYDPYYYQKINGGVIMFSNHYSAPGSDEIKLNKTIIFSLSLDRESWRSIDKVIFNTPNESFDFKGIPSIGKSSEYVVNSQYSCNPLRCSTNIRVNSLADNTPSGVYGMTITDTNGNTLKEITTYVSTQYISKANQNPPVDFSVFQEKSGELSIKVDLPPQTKLMKLELGTLKSNRVVDIESRILPSKEGLYTIELPDDTRAFKVGVSPVFKPMYEAANRRLEVYGNYPGYN